jgi:hypothetical protein
MRSKIDWNEIVPLLKKELREQLLAEALVLLSVTGGPKGNGSRPRSRLAAAPDTKLARQWLRDGDGQMLSAPGRRYRLIKDHKRPPANGVIGRVWRRVLESKTDAITYEVLASICKSEKITPSTMICTMWERGFIEVQL